MADVVDLRLSSVDKKTVDGERSVRLCNYSDVYHHSVIRADMDYMEATATEREIQNCRLEVGDVIITKDSETADDIGVPAVVGDEVPNLVCGYHLAILRPLKADLDGRFLHYALSGRNAKRQFQMYANSITRFGLRADDISRVKIPLPPIPEQRKIAAILFSVDDAIEKTQAAIDQARIVKRGLMQELFTRGLPNGTGSSDWSEERLGNLFTLQLGKMLNKRARETRPRFPYLGNKDVQWGRIRFSGLREMHFDEKDRVKYRLLPGDLLVCEGGEVGPTAILDRQVDCYYQKAIHRLRVLDNAKVEPRFILHYMRFAAANGMLTDLTAQSSIAHLTREKLSLLKVYLPPLPEQRAISDSLSAMDDFMAKSEAVIRQAQVAKQGTGCQARSDVCSSHR